MSEEQMPVKVYYNGACPICNTAIGDQRERMQACGLPAEWHDIHANPDVLKGLGVGQEEVRKKLYVVLSKGGATADQIGAVLPQHLEYMIGLEKTGVLFASGPLTAAPGAPAGDGLTILRATGAEEARTIASADPFVVNRLRTFEVREWTLMEGSFCVKVNFSDQSLDIA